MREMAGASRWCQGSREIQLTSNHPYSAAQHGTNTYLWQVQFSFAHFILFAPLHAAQLGLCWFWTSLPLCQMIDAARLGAARQNCTSPGTTLTLTVCRIMSIHGMQDSPFLHKYIQNTNDRTCLSLQVPPCKSLDELCGYS